MPIAKVIYDEMICYLQRFDGVGSVVSWVGLVIRIT